MAKPNQPNPHQKGNQPNPHQKGNQPNPHQKGNQPNPHQKGNQPNSHQKEAQPAYGQSAHATTAGKLVSMATFHVRPGKDQEFLKSLKEDLFRHCERMGGKNCSVQKKDSAGDYTASMHWANAASAERFMKSREMNEWYTKAAPYLKDGTKRETFELKQERAA